MEEIKVGEYVRTDDGRIYQVDFLEDEVFLSDKFYNTSKHSPNIIDLIEKSDIVEVLDNWTGNKQIIYIYDDSDISELKLDIKNGFLKLLSITTVEQFNQVKYEV